MVSHSLLSSESRAVLASRWDHVLDVVDDGLGAVEDAVRSRVEAARCARRSGLLLASGGAIRAAVRRTFAFEHDERARLFKTWAGVEEALHTDRGAAEPGRGRSEAARLLRSLQALEEFRARRWSGAGPRPLFGGEVEAVAARYLDDLAHAPVMVSDRDVRVTAERFREALRPVLGSYAARTVTDAYRLDLP